MCMKLRAMVADEANHAAVIVRHESSGTYFAEHVRINPDAILLRVKSGCTSNCQMNTLHTAMATSRLYYSTLILSVDMQQHKTHVAFNQLAASCAKC